MKRHYLFLLCSFLSLNLFAQNTTDHIHIDQFGYLPGGKKVAVISNPQTGFNNSESYTPGTTLEVLDEATGNVVYSAAPSAWNGGATHDQSGDQGWWFDFSSLTSPGSYYIRDADNNTRSYTFEIGDQVYNDLMKAAGRMFYYNRCNSPKSAPYADANWVDGDNFRNPLQDANCRYYLAPNDATQEKDLTGGWFDAGDYNKYVTFASSVIHDMLSAYEENTVAFGDDWNIPESGNGIADIIDEVKWELDWVKKMQNADGAVIIKMGSISYADNDQSPPSANVDARYYGPTCTSATIVAAGMFAHASAVFANIPGLSAEADVLKTLAELSWNQVLPSLQANSLETGCDDGTIKAGDADREVGEQREDALRAAIYLFEITGHSDYGDYISANVQDATSVSGAWLSPYVNSTNEALLRYTTFANASATTVNEIINAILPHVQGDWNGFFGFNPDDLYRAFMPSWSYHWGSNNVKAQYAILNQMLVRYNLNASGNAAYLQKAEEQLHYYHGVNPLNKVYLSNMYDYGAENCANEIYHAWFDDGTDYDNAVTSLYGPAPGYVVGGSNKDYSYSLLNPPYGQPDQKAYLDFNDGFPEASWEITEPAIYYQSAYLRLLAAYTVANSGPLPVSLAAFSAENKGEDVQVKWTTASEVNTKEIIVERSTDASNWNTAGIVDAAGNSTSSTDYEYLDVNPWGTGSLLYYRLKFVDLSGEFTFSNIESVEKIITGTKTFEAAQMLFHPNPATDKLFITFPNFTRDHQLSVFDNQGVLKMRKNNGEMEIDLLELPAGIYHLELATGAEKWHGRFVKL